MKKTILFIAGFMTFAVMAFSQNAPKKGELTSSPNDEPKLSLLKTETIDVGKLEKGNPKTVTFEFKNTGKAPLLISSAKGQCGCTNVEYSKNAILPNELGFIKATFNAESTGVFSKEITVISNSTDPQMQLYIKGEVL